MADWLAALDEEKRARPSFATMEGLIETPEELRAYRAWRLGGAAVNHALLVIPAKAGIQ
jgi:hypothetical protein